MRAGWSRWRHSSANCPMGCARTGIADPGAKRHMCNLYRMSKSQTEVADFFRDIVPELTLPPTGNAPEEIYPGYPGLVLTSTEIRQMVWGFPLSLKGAKGQPLKPRPVNNARTDKLSGAFWADSFRQRRC